MIEIQSISKKVNFLTHITKKSISIRMDGFNDSNDVRALFDSLFHDRPSLRGSIMASGIPKLMEEESIFPSSTGEGFPERSFIKFGLCL